LSNDLMAIYVQYQKTPISAPHGAPKKERERIRNVKNSDSSEKKERKKGRSTLRVSGKPDYMDARCKIKDLFTKDNPDKLQIWPAIQYGVVNSNTVKDARVQQVQPFPNDKSGYDYKHFILQYFPDTFHFVRFLNTTVFLNRTLDKCGRTPQNPQVKIEIDITGFDKNKVPKIKKGARPTISLIDKKHPLDLDLSPSQINPTQFVLLIKFNRVKSKRDTSSDESSESSDDSKNEKKRREHGHQRKHSSHQHRKNLYKDEESDSSTIESV